MKDIKILGVDIAKDVFLLWGIREEGEKGDTQDTGKACSVCIHRSQS